MKKCVIVSGVPSEHRSSLAAYLAETLKLPLISGDQYAKRLTPCFPEAEKECAEAAKQLMFDIAEQLMRCEQPFILENAFEDSEKEQVLQWLKRFEYWAVTIVMTADADFTANGTRIVADTANWDKVHFGMLRSWVREELFG